MQFSHTFEKSQGCHIVCNRKQVQMQRRRLFFERDLLFSNSESDKLHGALLCPSVNFKGSLNCELHLALKIMDV